MRSRRRAREAAVQALYQCDILNDWSYERIDSFYSYWVNKEEDSPKAAMTDAQRETAEANLKFSKLLCYGVADNLKYLDRKIRAASSHWPLERMQKVDRNIIRLGAFELAFVGDIPMSVSINEAIEVARTFASDESLPFVNAVLDRLGKDLSRIPQALAEIMNAGNLKAA